MHGQTALNFCNLTESEEMTSDDETARQLSSVKDAEHEYQFNCYFSDVSEC